MSFDISREVVIFGHDASGALQPLPILKRVKDTSNDRIVVQVQLPDVKADPQEVVTLKLQLEGQNQMIAALTDQVKSWEKRFDALLAVKGGAA